MPGSNMQNKNIGNGNNIQNSRVQNGDQVVDSSYIKSWLLNSFDRTIDYSIATMRGIFLVSGGACVALLALWDKVSIEILPWLIGSLLVLAIACLLAVFSNGFSYLAQKCYTTAVELKSAGSDGGKFSASGKRYTQWAIGISILAVVFIVAGILLFALPTMCHREAICRKGSICRSCNCSFDECNFCRSK